MTFHERVRMYAEAMRWVGLLTLATPASALAGPTPCEEYDVRALTGHLIGTAERSLGTAEGRPTREIPHVITDVDDADLAGRYISLTRQISIAWTRLAAAREITAPWGTCSAEDAVLGFTVETLVHGWDLAVATDQPVEAPDGLAESVISSVDHVIPAGTRARMYAPGAPPAAGAGPTERLAHLLGHHRPQRRPEQP